ncbi:Oidioi.mRNA.OKI2018_I69.chr1.g3572.t2.cds [Oikopleura dioica]|uniref:Oidioi.mRNA.OKI2018_I69.chr1.g3572.t2.cds n=1 Tax=Oikopleura dioica TaxID=34765 RepID=A0ABN7SWA7_OIKDI|nr:Oidioi.mRNA.OKI2018_I69.chr1.g3572.t2.cds [Oikopleura dioica]
MLESLFQARAQFFTPEKADSCCGRYPNRFPYNTSDTEKECCDGSIISSRKNVCCHGRVTSIIGCEDEKIKKETDDDEMSIFQRRIVFLYDEGDQNAITSTASPISYETMFETYTTTADTTKQTEYETTSSSATYEYETYLSTVTTGTTKDPSTTTSTLRTLPVLDSEDNEDYETSFSTVTTGTTKEPTTTMTSTFGDFPGPCFPNPCLNDGECIESPNSEFPWLAYSCICLTVPIHFTGRNCQYGPCNPNPCINGGRCKIADFKREKEYSNIECFCPKGYGGNYCELRLY